LKINNFKEQKIIKFKNNNNKKDKELKQKIKFKNNNNVAIQLLSLLEPDRILLLIKD
jgi:hypothetical protein